MPNCELRILFDQPERLYRTGEAVSGSVTVVTTAQVDTKSLTLRAFWATRGRGNVDQGETAQSVLFKGRWRPGREYAYPFEFTAPEFPPTIRGGDIHVDHYLEVRADIPWALDPKVREDYLLLTSGTKGRVLAKSTNEAHGVPKTTAGSGGGLRILFLIGLGVLWLVLPPSVKVAAAAVLAMVAKQVHTSWKSSRDLGTVTTHLDSSRIRVGEDISLKVGLHPGAAIDNAEIALILKATEVCAKGSGKNYKQKKRVLIKKREVIKRKFSFRPGRTTSVDHRMQIPLSAPPSFHAKGNKIQWTLTLEIQGKKLSKWTREWRLLVDPMLADESMDRASYEQAELPQAQPPPLIPPAFPPGARDDVVQVELSKTPHWQSFEPVSLPAASEKEPDVRSGEFERGEIEWQGKEPSIATDSTLDSAEAPIDDKAEIPAPNPREVVQDPQALPESVPPESPGSAETSGPADFASLLAEIQALDRFGEERKLRIADELGAEYELLITLERVKWTYGNVGEKYAKGRVLVGKLQSNGPVVEVRLPETLNAAADGLRRGARVRLRGTLATWNSTYGSPEFEAQGFEPVEAP